MKILMLCPLLSSSSMITIYPMAKALSKKHDVKLVGPLMGKDAFIKDKSLDIECLEPFIKNPQQAAMLSLYPRNLLKVLAEDYDVIHTFKLLPHTAPVASLAKRLNGKKFVLSIDDYDSASARNPFKRAVMKWSEKSYRNADAITVSSSQLQKIYGGEILYQVPNEEIFMKTKTKPEQIKRKLGIDGKKMILYAGTFYDHKGVDILIRAVQMLGTDVKLVLAGYGSCESLLRKIAGPETIFLGKLSMEKVAEITSACDVYAIPTKDTNYSRAEIPGKIFEPMMLGKPIVASRLSDIPEILGNGKCGVLTKPDSIDDLSKNIANLIENKTKSKKIAAAASERYFEKYSMEHFEKKINKIYDTL